jgi:hypothetical protein
MSCKRPAAYDHERTATDHPDRDRVALGSEDRLRICGSHSGGLDVRPMSGRDPDGAAVRHGNRVMSPHRESRSQAENAEGPNWGRKRRQRSGLRQPAQVDFSPSVKGSYRLLSRHCRPAQSNGRCSLGTTSGNGEDAPIAATPWIARKRPSATQSYASIDRLLDVSLAAMRRFVRPTAPPPLGRKSKRWEYGGNGKN